MEGKKQLFPVAVTLEPLEFGQLGFPTEIHPVTGGARHEAIICIFIISFQYQTKCCQIALNPGKLIDEGVVDSYKELKRRGIDPYV